MPTLLGCAQLNNPWIDSSVAINDDMRTPSSDAYGKKDQAELRLEHGRTWPGSQVTYHNGAVTHWPLWFEDPFEDKGNSYCPPADRDAPDNEFTWNGVDYLHLAYGPARMSLNGVAWPISAVVTPPGTLMESNGRLDKGLLGYDHDAKRAKPDREPPDLARLTPTYGHPENESTAANSPAGL